MVSFVLTSIDDKLLAWNMVFYIAIISYLIGGIVFCIWADAEEQEWAKSKYILSSEEPIDEENHNESIA